VGSSIEGEFHLIMDAIFSYPIQCLLFFVLFLFLFMRIAGGHCLGMVTSGDSVNHKHFTDMRSLSRHGDPFLLAMPPRSTTLIW
jgi:hypothetical protein